MSRPHAVIIAGGKGERLGGVCKAELRVGGIRLIDRVRSALGDVAEPLMVSTGPVQARLRPGGAIAVRDLAGPTGGPLAGLAAAVEALRVRGVISGLLVSVPVDTPFLPSDYVSILQQNLGDAPAACAAWGDQSYPPNAIWQIDALAALPDEVREGTGVSSLKALLQRLGAVTVDWRGLAAENPFLNLNTVDDLLTLGRMARSDTPAPLIHSLGK